ncbi:hypothetical protein [Polaribacter sp. M15]
MKRFFYTAIVFFGFFISCSDDATEVNEELEEEVAEEICSIANNDGLLIIEAESFELKGQWRIVEDEKASGGKYIEYYGPNTYQTQNLANEIVVKFKVDAAANYRVKWYMRQPDDAEGDKSNDAWIYLEDNIGYAWVNNASLNLTHYEKFVSRGKGEFTYGGALDLHNPKSSSWLTAKFPEAGEYTLKICSRSQYFQLDKIVLSSGITNDEAKEKSQTLSEFHICE